MTETERIAAMEQTLRENQAQNLAWVSNMAAHLVKMDRRIELMEEIQRDIRNILQEMCASRQNGAPQ